MEKTNTLGRVSAHKITNVRDLVKLALLSAIAVVLMVLELPLPIFPGFLKFDISDLPALLGAFAMGPAAGIIIEFMKNVLHILVKGTSTGGVGELANFIIGVGFVVPAAMIYIKMKSKKGALIGMVVGTVAMAVLGALANYYVLIPLYEKFMPLDAIIAMAAQANKSIVDVGTYVLYAVIPFNILKAVTVSLVTLLVYKKMSPILHK